MVIFSDVKISCFRAKALLVFHWCLYNKSIFLNSCSSCFTLQHILHQPIKLSYTKRWISVSSGHFRLFIILLISSTMGAVDPWLRSKDDFTSWMISLGKTEASAKRDARVKASDTFLIMAPAEVVEVKVSFKESNCSWSSAQALWSVSIALWTLTIINIFVSSALRYHALPPSKAPIPAPAAAAIKLAPKVKGAAKPPTTADAADATNVVEMSGFLSRDGRFLANSSNFSLVFLLTGSQWRKASCNSVRSLSNIWLAVTKERERSDIYVNLESKFYCSYSHTHGGNQNG